MKGVRVSHEPGVGPPLLAVMYSADVSNVTMSKGEKHAFVSGLSIMNEGDQVLTALVSNTPLNAVHMVVVTESELAWERPDVEVLQLDNGLAEDTQETDAHHFEETPRFVGCHV